MCAQRRATGHHTVIRNLKMVTRSQKTRAKGESGATTAERSPWEDRLMGVA